MNWAPCLGLPALLQSKTRTCLCIPTISFNFHWWRRIVQYLYSVCSTSSLCPCLTTLSSNAVEMLTKTLSSHRAAFQTMKSHSFNSTRGLSWCIVVHIAYLRESLNRASRATCWGKEEPLLIVSLDHEHGCACCRSHVFLLTLSTSASLRSDKHLPISRMTHSLARTLAVYESHGAGPDISAS